MKLIIIIILAVITFQKWDTISAYINSPAKTANYTQANVELLVAEWCGYCKKTREFLKANNIPFTEYDVERTYEGKMRYEKMRVKGVPIVLVNDNIVQGYNPQQILAYLNN